MKSFVKDFIRRGLAACGLGPLVLAVLYYILNRQGILQELSVDQVCVGIVSLLLLAFVAGGLNALYQLEKLPLMFAILIHGSALYLCYLVTYLLNDWLAWGIVPVLVFSAIYAVGFVVIWTVIYAMIKARTSRLNEILKRNQVDTAV